MPNMYLFNSSQYFISLKPTPHSTVLPAKSGSDVMFCLQSY